MANPSGEDTREDPDDHDVRTGMVSATGTPSLAASQGSGPSGQQLVNLIDETDDQHVSDAKLAEHVSDTKVSRHASSTRRRPPGFAACSVTLLV